MKIAIDGPAGAGKSTVAKKVAEKLKLLYIDTGAMYRAITYGVIKNKINIDNEKEVAKFLDKLDFRLNQNELSKEMDIFINGELVNSKLRNREVDKNVSKISSYKKVREFLVSIQQKLGSEYDVILDGRDIGTVVFPNADFKFYIDASVEERADRRLKDIKNKEHLSYDEIKREIIERDKLDSTRKISPLKKAVDAVYIDTSNMGIDEVVDRVISIVLKK